MHIYNMFIIYITCIYVRVCVYIYVFHISSPEKSVVFLNVTIINSTEIIKTHRKELCQQDFQRMRSLP